MALRLLNSSNLEQLAFKGLNINNNVKMLCPSLLYCDALSTSGIDPLDDSREMITQSLFMEIKSNSPSPLLVIFY